MELCPMHLRFEARQLCSIGFQHTHASLLSTYE